ncbi:MAG: HNH endonuclease, partial [Oscillospiraceae bacterium]|nr:HNH endonuclease [Oscillospiraceae bacterium]
VHHINGDKKDNRPENLEVMDWREHSRMHASRMVQTPEKLRKVSEARKGKPNAPARQLKDEQVEAIVRALSGGKNVTALAAKYGVSDHVIRNIRDGKTYRDVLEKLPQELFPLPQAKPRTGGSKRRLDL